MRMLNGRESKARIRYRGGDVGGWRKGEGKHVVELEIRDFGKQPHSLSLSLVGFLTSFYLT